MEGHRFVTLPAPADASARIIPCPIPWVDPVTRATRPARDIEAEGEWQRERERERKQRESRRNREREGEEAEREPKKQRERERERKSKTFKAREKMTSRELSTSQAHSTS
jgi:type IV secretory pathway VirB10-like protein